MHSKRRVASVQLSLIAPSESAVAHRVRSVATPRSTARAVVDAPLRTVVESPPRQLWLGLRFKRLSVMPYEADSQPTAVEEAGVIVAANRLARAATVHLGLSVAEALWRCDGLVTRAVDPQQQAQALDRLAFKAARFSPWVSVEPPECVLLEVKGSLKLFGGLEALMQAVQETFVADGVDWAVAPYPLAAAWLSHQSASVALTATAVRQQLDRLRLDHFGVYSGERAWVADLKRVGLSTLEQLRRLPRRGLALRGGLAGLPLLDQAYGLSPTPRRAWVEPIRFKRTWEGDDALSNAHALRAVCRHLLEQQALFLKQHSAGVSEVHWRLNHRGGHVRWVWRLRAVSADPQQWLDVGGAGYFDRPLPAAVTAITVRSGRLRWVEHRHTLPGVEPLPAERDAARQQWVQRVQGRLGRDAIHGLSVVAEHRPEHAMGHRYAEHPPPVGEDVPWGCRPVWLLDAPQALAMKQHKPWLHGPVSFVNGPERIESGWWDDVPIARDYYTVQLRHGRRAWIYREVAAPDHWYLHGWFG